MKAKNHFCKKLLTLFSSKRLVLFAGAGVGTRAGLPDWSGFVEHLISVASRYEEETASLMRVRAKQGKLAEAVHYFKVCDLIPQGEKYSQLASPFEKSRYDHTRLHSLVKLPFEAVVTTNFDSSLHDSWAAINRCTPRSFELDDQSLKQADFYEDFYIARIHGRVEMPQSMVVERDDFLRLETDELYKNFVAQAIFLRRTCLFIGYSFVDPAVRKILETIEKLVGPTYPQKHYALVPAEGRELTAQMARFNIEVIPYENHGELWRCIDSLPEALVEEAKPAKVAGAFRIPYERMRLFLANCYVKSQLSRVSIPLRELAEHGIVLSIIERHPSGISIEAASRELRGVIAATEQDAMLITSRAVSTLVEKGWAELSNGQARLIRTPEKVFDRNLEFLVTRTLYRFAVRQGDEKKPEHSTAIRRTLEEIFISRGWDLGAQFVGAKALSTTDMLETIRRSMRNLLPNEYLDRQERLSRSIYDLLRRPDKNEAQILSDVARISFGLGVLLQFGASVLKQEVLPERIYLDSNVLLPAITEGHPLRPVYQSVIKKLGKAASEAGRTCELLVSPGFLNEIVSHRERALKLVERLKLEDPDKLERHILYYGADNTNVFVGAYATWVGREKRQIAFETFLEDVAPYNNEGSLAAFLESTGIKSVGILQDRPFRELQSTFFRVLRNGYQELEKFGWVGKKPDILIDHEATQLTQLELELKSGRRTYFVTADKALREIVGLVRMGISWNVTISHLGLIQLTDLLVGIEAEPISLARALWAISEMDEKAALRDYLVDLVLKKRDAAMVMALPEIIDTFVMDAERAAKIEGIRFFTRDEEDKANAARFLDRFEEEFFRYMAEAVVRHKKAEN